MNLYEMLVEKALQRGKYTAIVFENEKIKYRDLIKKIDAFSQILLDFGIKKDEKVAILLKNSPDFIIAYFAILKIGGVVVPLNFFSKEQELSYILNNAKVVLLITSYDFKEIAENVKLNCKSLKEVFYMERTKPGSSVAKELSFAPEVKEEDVATILYTSGTTGHPKGTLLTHKNFISNVISCSKAINVNPEDRFLCFLPMFHSFSWTICVLLPLWVGARIVVVSSLKPLRKFFATIFKRRITLFAGIPAIYNALIRMPGFLARIIFRRVRICVSGADALSPETLEKFEKKFRIPLLEGYGLTEASPVVSINPLDRARKPGTIGLPLPDVEVKVVDEKGDEAPKDVPGELIVKGANVMKGYYELEMETNEAIKG
ncbi:AMP-binding protein, partial [bacterium]|nr:AMP-binding protein [bacterium]